MRKALLAAVCVLVGVGPVRASDPTLVCTDYHVFGRIDYLNWRVRDTPIPPLVTTSILPTDMGILGRPTTAILLGDELNYDAFNGARFVAGLWFDPDAIFGFEGSATYLAPQTASEGFVSDFRGIPVLSVPIIDSGVGESVVVIANENSNTGSIFVNSQLKFYAGNADFVVTTCRTECVETNFFIGFKAAYLEETLDIATVTTPFFGGGAAIFRGDQFKTRNFFYGGEIGARMTQRRDICFLELTGKIAAGSNFETVTISGNTLTIPPVGPSFTTPGAIFAQPSNSGSYSRNQLMIMPEVQARVGLELSSSLKVSLGYDFLLMTAVARPGNQIDRIIGPVDGVTHPTFSDNNIKSSSFYVHGWNLGLELRF